MERDSLKVYKGFSEDADSATGPIAVVVEDEAGKISRLRHQVRHSPDGFSWGYGGSGPADLARSILAEHLGYIPSPAIYQRFKFEYVAKWEQGRPWRISSDEITAFLGKPGIRQLIERRLRDDG